MISQSSLIYSSLIFSYLFFFFYKLSSCFCPLFYWMLDLFPLDCKQLFTYNGNQHFSVQFIQSLSRVRLFVTPWTAAHQASLSITNSQSLLKLMSIESVMPSNHLILCRPLLLLPSVFPRIRVCSNESALHIRWPKYWSFSFNISPSNEHSGLISFRMDWLDLLAVQGTLKSFPTPQVKSINSLAFSFLYSPILTSIHDHWKNHSLDQTDLCWQSNVSAF